MTKNKGKGDCYEVHGNMIVEKYMAHTGDGWFLCHGQAIGRGLIEGIKHGHSWLEYGDVAFDYSNGINGAIRKQKYYELGQITKVVKYTPKQASMLMLKTEHYGAWNKKERLLVGLK